MILYRPVGTKELQLIADWVPAEELEEFNRHIIGKIEIISEYV